MSQRENSAGSVAPLRRQEEAADLLELLIEQVVDYAIFVLDPQGRIATWNAGAQRIKGYARSEIIGAPYAIFFTDDDRRRGKPEQILESARTHGRYQEEGWRVRKDGTRLWVLAVLTALRGPHGELKGFAKITRDLSERKRAEEEARHAAEEKAARRQAELDEREVRRSRDQLRVILQSISEAVTVQSPDGRLVFVNDAAAALFGFESAAALQAVPPLEVVNAFDVFREDGSRFPVEELPGRLALAGTPSTAIVRYKVKRTGEERWSIVSAAPVLDPSGRVEMAVNVVRDFTERKHTEEAWAYLAETSAALASSLEYQVTLKQIADLAVPRIADWCSVEMAGSGGELQQLAVAHVDPSKRALAEEWRRRWPPRLDSPTYQVLRTGESILIPEITDQMIEAQATDPEQRRLASQLGLRSAMIVALQVRQQPFGVITFITAESDRRYTQQDLQLAVEVARRASLAIENARAFTDARAAVQTRDNFLSIASHELKTPLSGLTMMLTTLIRLAAKGRLGELGPDGLKDRLMKAERQTQQLTRLVDRLLDVSRLTTRDLRPELEEMDLCDVARDVISRFRDDSDQQSRIELKAAGPVIGRWDRGQLDQAITNLVGNAVKYGAGTPVTVMVASTSRHARVSVRDEGPGVAAEDQERIFGQFERAGASDDVPGLGLGLWLVRRIVAGHGGTVTLESSPGRGAVFTLVLPIAPTGAETKNNLPGELS